MYENPCPELTVVVLAVLVSCKSGCPVTVQDAGAQLIYQDMTITEKTTHATQNLAALRACPMVFYEFKSRKHDSPLTLTPWASYRFDVLRKDAAFATRTYQTQFANFAMGVNVGYTFATKHEPH